MNKIIPDKLRNNDTVKIIAPSISFTLMTQENRELADKRFEEIGLKITFGKHLEEVDDFFSSSIQSRVEDLHDAFADKSIKAVFTVIGGYNSNQLLRFIDWNLIKENPKIFCGYSDITALNNAIFAKTGLLTYSGAHYSTFSQKLYLDYTLDYFKKCLFSDDPFSLEPSENWSDDIWYRDQDNRTLIPNDGYFLINEGEGEGPIWGANLCTFNLLHGTEYMPGLADSVLFIEDDNESLPHTFDRDLQSLIHQPGFSHVKGILIGRFQIASRMTYELLEQIIKTKKELDHIPVIANVDFGHTDPMITFPIGGQIKIQATKDEIRINITEH
jgi:muramoyltetrapeptide carboxypeptidase